MSQCIVFKCGYISAPGSALCHWHIDQPKRCSPADPHGIAYPDGARVHHGMFWLTEQAEALWLTWQAEAEVTA